MSDIRLVNVVPIVNGWNDAAKKNLEEAKTLWSKLWSRSSPAGSTA